jgi:hypothetical protein
MLEKRRDIGEEKGCGRGEVTSEAEESAGMSAVISHRFSISSYRATSADNADSRSLRRLYGDDQASDDVQICDYVSTIIVRGEDATYRTTLATTQSSKRFAHRMYDSSKMPECNA